MEKVLTMYTQKKTNLLIYTEFSHHKLAVGMFKLLVVRQGM